MQPKFSIKELLARPTASVLFGVHNALGAKIADEAGADGLWISSFEVHAAHRLPDADILGTEDYVHVIAQIVDRVQIPILVDGNAGGGNAINTIRLVREFEKSGALGMCIEDNPFPKRCSFYDGMQEDLEPVSTFQGKIQACIEKRTVDDFAIIARTEALNKGLGVDIALERGKAYAAAGAEGVPFITRARTQRRCSSSPSGGTRARTFRWSAFRRPTTRSSSRTSRARASSSSSSRTTGSARSSTTLRDTFGAIMEHRRLADANGRVASMQDIFDLIYLDELKENEARYLR